MKDARSHGMGMGVAEGGTDVLDGNGVCEGSGVLLGKTTAKVAVGKATSVEAGDEVSWAFTVCAAAVYRMDGSSGVSEDRFVRLQAARSVKAATTKLNNMNLLRYFIIPSTRPGCFAK